MESNKDKNYYEILEIPITASDRDIHQGYIRAKNAYSQDSLALYSLMTKEECDNIIEIIEEAYSILSDPDKRQQYDEARGFSNSPEHYSSYRSSSPIGTLKNQTMEINHNEKTRTTSMTKIVANKRFALEFEANSEMDQKIEEAVEYTGDFLKEIREYKNVSIPRLADMTKVSKTYLTNIEEENLEGLPAMVYVRGFVYQYAKCLKLNPDLVANSYLERIKNKQNDG